MLSRLFSAKILAGEEPETSMVATVYVNARTVAEAAKELGMSKRTLERMIRDSKKLAISVEALGGRRHG